MAIEGYIETQGNLIAAADYSAAANQGKIVKISTAAAETALLCSVDGERGDGILMNKPVAGAACEVVTDGFAKAQCGAAIASGGLELAVDATGRLITAVSTKFVIAISRHSTANAGEWVGVKLCGPYVKA